MRPLISAGLAFLLTVCAGLETRAQSALPGCPSDQRKTYNNCFGTYTTSGNTYVGEFKQDKPDGQGKSTYADGSSYTGGWSKARHHGQGTLIWADGEKYVGEWKAGQRDGYGRLYRPDGSLKTAGIWANDRILKPDGFVPPLVRSVTGAPGSASSPLLRIVSGHAAPVLAVAASPDGRTILSGESGGGQLRLTEVTSGTLLRTFNGHTSSVPSVAFSPDGATALSASFDKTIRLWDVSSGKLIRTFKGHSEAVSAVAFTPGGATFVSASDDKTLKLWDIASGRVLRTFTGHARPASSVAVTPDGRSVISGSRDATLKVWDLETGRLLRTLEGHAGDIFSVAISRDGRRAASVSRDGKLKLWDVGSGQLARTLDADVDLVYGVAFSPNGQTLVSGGEDMTVKLWEADSGQLLRTLPGHSGSVLAVAMLPDGRTAVSGGEDSALMVWDIEAPPAPAGPAPAGAAVAMAAVTAAGMGAGASSPGPAAPEPGGAAQAAPPSPSGPLPNRVALVIGNSAYSGMTRLANPGRDAKAVAEALRKIGFTEVIEAFDLSRPAMLAVLNGFSGKAAQADWAMVYYAGHGMEMNGVNYLIPVDAKLLSDVEVADEAIPLDRVLRSIAHTRKLRLVVLDACRDNPFASRMVSATLTRSVSRGLAPVEPGGSTYVVYAAKHGQVAQDGNGTNSPFVAALVKHMMTPRLEIDRMFRRVSAEVLQATGNRQEPFTYGRLPDEDLFFALQ